MSCHYIANLFFSVIFPDGLVTTQHSNISFFCSAPTQTLTGVQWLINSMILEDIDSTEITAEFSNELGGVGRLNFTNIPLAYNKTNITCVAEIASAQEEFVTTTLLIQGSCN